MELMSFNHPSIIQLSNRKMSKMNYSLLISVFGFNQGIRLFKNNGSVNRAIASQVLITTYIANASSNLIISNDIKAKFEEKNKAFSDLTKRVLNKLNALYAHHPNQYKHSRVKQRYLYHSNSFQRYNTQNSQLSYQHYVLTIILIQKHIRGHIAKRKIYQIVNTIIRERSMKYIISLQSQFRQYNQLKKTKLTALHKKVIDVRKAKCNTIINLLSSYQHSIADKKEVIINKLLDYRRVKIILIQSIVKKTRLVKLVKTIIAYEKANYVLTYPFYARKVQLKLYLDSKPNAKYQFIIPIAPRYKLFSFEYCRLRNVFILYIKKEEIAIGKYRCQLIVDGCVTCDGRFPHIEGEDGQFYNLIEFNQGRVMPSAETKQNTIGSNEDSKESGNGNGNNNTKKYISSDEEDIKTYATLKKNLEANPPNCFYNKKWIKNICLDYANETQEDFFNSIKKNK